MGLGDRRAGGAGGIFGLLLFLFDGISGPSDVARALLEGNCVVTTAEFVVLFGGNVGTVGLGALFGLIFIEAVPVGTDG